MQHIGPVVVVVGACVDVDDDVDGAVVVVGVCIDDDVVAGACVVVDADDVVGAGVGCTSQPAGRGQLAAKTTARSGSCSHANLGSSGTTTVVLQPASGLARQPTSDSSSSSANGKRGWQ